METRLSNPEIFETLKAQYVDCVAPENSFKIQAMDRAGKIFYVNEVGGHNTTEKNVSFPGFKVFPQFERLLQSGALKVGYNYHIIRYYYGSFNSVIFETLIKAAADVDKADTPEIENNSHKTAISRKSLSAPMKYFQSASFLNAKSGLDFGCGKGFDADLLGLEKYDPYFFPEETNKTFDFVTCNYVLNVISYSERLEVINKAFSHVKVGGLLLISVRSDKDINSSKKSTWIEHEDGYITPKKTFQTGFSSQSLSDTIEAALNIDTFIVSSRGCFICAIITKEGC